MKPMKLRKNLPAPIVEAGDHKSQTTESSKHSLAGGKYENYITKINARKIVDSCNELES